MTDFTYDRSFSTDFTSSVIDKVYYNSDTKQLLVELARLDWNRQPVRAGYQDVPADVFTAMESLNKNRVDKGDDSASVGSYWNAWIKPNFKGFDTAGLEPVSAKQPDVEDVSASEVVEINSTGGTFTTTISGNVTAAIADSGAYFAVGSAPLVGHKTDFTVIFKDDRGDGSITITASDESDALTRFNQIATLAQWQGVKISAIARHFG